MSFMPPEPVLNETYTKVHVQLDILAVLEIAEVDSYISMQVEMRLTW